MNLEKIHKAAQFYSFDAEFEYFSVSEIKGEQPLPSNLSVRGNTKELFNSEHEGKYF